MRRILFVLLACLAFRPGTAIQAAEQIKGQSKELGIDFEVKGGSSWCAPDIDVVLSASRSDTFRLETPPFVQMVGRLRAIVASECPAIERIRFAGRSAGADRINFEMTRLTGWRRLIVVDPATKQPSCLASQDKNLCEFRATAYAAAHEMMRGDLFQNVEIVTALDDPGPTHLIWRVGDIVGKIAILEKSKTGDISPADGALTRIVAEAAATACARTGGAAEQLAVEAEKKSAQVGVVRCRSDVGAHTQAIVSVDHKARSSILLSAAAPASAEEQVVGILIALAVR